MSDKRPRATATKKIILLVCFISAGYVGVRWGLFSELTNPGEYLDYNKWNAFGDFLAGFFAPLAFFWLVAAVFIQRQDLKETQTQYQDSQKQLLKSQELVGQQMQFIALQNKNAELVAERNYKLALFEPRVEIYKQLLSLKITEEMTSRVLYRKFKRIEDIKARSNFLFGVDVTEWLTSVNINLWELAWAVRFKNNSEPTGDGRSTDGTYYRDDEELNRQIMFYTSEVASGLSDDKINEKLLPYLKVYEE